MKDIDAKPPEARLGDREVDLELAVEFLELFTAHQLHRRLAHHLRGQFKLVDGQDLAVDLDLDRGIAGEEQVGSPFLDHQTEEWLNVHDRGPAP